MQWCSCHNIIVQLERPQVSLLNHTIDDMTDLSLSSNITLQRVRDMTRPITLEYMVLSMVSVCWIGNAIYSQRHQHQRRKCRGHWDKSGGCGLVRRTEDVRCSLTIFSAYCRGQIWKCHSHAPSPWVDLKDAAFVTPHHSHKHTTMQGTSLGDECVQ